MLTWLCYVGWPLDMYAADGQFTGQAVSVSLSPIASIIPWEDSRQNGCGGKLIVRTWLYKFLSLAQLCYQKVRLSVA